MSNIILDTSVLATDFRLRANVLRAVLRTAKDLRDHVYVPKIVIDELINKFRENLQSLCDSLHSCEEKIVNLIGSHMQERRIEISEQVVMYSDWLQSELSKNEIESISYPNISHELVVKRALARRKPFSSKGQDGYRDTVLWETILKWSRDDRHEVLFVSKNKHDFADSNNPHKLHPHLIEDLRALRQDESRVQFFDCFEDLLARALYPRQRLFPELEVQVRNGRLGQQELIPWLVSILPGIAVKFRREQLRHKEWVISEVHDIKQLSLNSTSRLTERTILVVLFFTFSADIAPKQSELLLEETSETRSVRFISFISVECELETYTIVSVEFDHVVCLDEW